MAELSGNLFSVEEFDIDFEFDAPRSFDFSRSETDSEVGEAELWFESAGSYPPSPFSVKFNWRYDFLKDCGTTFPESKVREDLNYTNDCLDVGLDSEVTPPEDKYNGFIYYNQTVKDPPKATPNSQTKSSLSRSSTLTKPTASLLARQNKPLDVYSVNLLRRCQRSLSKFDDKIPSLFSSMTQSQDTKRQKLEAGYLRKVSHLDQAHFVHKVPKKVGRVNSLNGRSKVTIPKEPELKTAQRAERHRSKVNSETGDHSKQNSSTSKERQANKKILEASSLSIPKRSTERVPDFQAFHLRTSERATHRASNNMKTTPDNSVSENITKQSKMLKSVDTSKKEKCKGIRKLKKKPQINESKVCPIDQKMSSGEKFCEIQEIKEDTATFPRVLPDASCEDEAPIESFSKLSLASEAHPDVNSQPKRHMPEIVNMVMKRSESFHGDNYPYGSDRKPLL